MLETTNPTTPQHHAADQAQRVADLEAERDRLRHDHHQLRVDAAVVRALAAERERDELRARLADLEGQEPVCCIHPDGAIEFNPAGAMPDDGMLYARPVPAIPAGWLPIETAPKGKTRVLLKWPGHREHCVGAWCLDAGASKPAPYWSGDTDRLHGVRETRTMQPTHWMPIPAAPEGAR